MNRDNSYAHPLEWIANSRFLGLCCHPRCHAQAIPLRKLLAPINARIFHRGVSERSVSAKELASVSPGLPSGSKPEVLDISAAVADDELRPR